MCITSITGNVILSEAKDLDSSPAAQNDKKKAPDTLGTFDTRDTFKLTAPQKLHQLQKNRYKF